MKKKHRLKRRLVSLSLGLCLLLPACIQKDNPNAFLYPSVTYSYRVATDESVLCTGLSKTYLYLANKQNPVPKSYDPGTLVTLSTDYAWRATIQLETRTAKALMAMMEEMWADGVRDAKVTSGYRTYDYQNSLYEGYIAKEMANGLSRAEAEKKVAAYSAPPGYSEHQTGFVVDFLQTGASDLTEAFENSAAFAWLSENCYRFGFILRYPKSADQIAITGYDYEPWHYRFVGREAATEIMKRGITLEEFLELDLK